MSQTKKPATKQTASKPGAQSGVKTGAAKNGNPVLTYFNGRGRCEHIRYILAVGKITYTDKRIEQGDWPDLKPKTPFGTLPMFETDGMVFGQSIAIGRLAATKAKLYGSNDLERCVIDGVVDAVTDLREAFVAIAFFKGDDKVKEEKAKASMEQLEKTLGYLAKILGNKDYFVNKLSWADIHFYTIMENVVGQHKDILSKHSALGKLYKKVDENAEIQAYKKKRPETAF